MFINDTFSLSLSLPVEPPAVVVFGCITALFFSTQNKLDNVILRRQLSLFFGAGLNMRSSKLN